jgi:hypothetical protein
MGLNSAETGAYCRRIAVAMQQKDRDGILSATGRAAAGFCQLLGMRQTFPSLAMIGNAFREET